jgi:hypothetical protein
MTTMVRRILVEVEEVYEVGEVMDIPNTKEGLKTLRDYVDQEVRTGNFGVIGYRDEVYKGSDIRKYEDLGPTNLIRVDQNLQETVISEFEE